MSRSKYTFQRWKSRSKSSWAWRVFKKHSLELYRMYASFDSGKRYAYKKLKSDQANWSDDTDKHFTFQRSREADLFSDLKDWSNACNDLENWINLNALVAISSNLETFMATIIGLALESDVGTIYGFSQKIDGIEILKNGKANPFDHSAAIMACTKNDWGARLSAYERYFGQCPAYLKSKISELERIRILRNSVAHAFGRDISASRKAGELTTLPIERLPRESFHKLQAVVWRSAKAIDAHLNNFHIGEYQSLLFYHKIYPELNKDLHPSMRAIALKKRLGWHGDEPAGKEFCKGLVEYYEGL